MPIFTGSGVAAVTPFDADGNVNFNAYEKLIDFLIQNGSDAIISCGTTGEASTLTQSEHLDVVACAVQAAGGRVPVIAGAGSNHTAFGVDTCKGAQKRGANGLLLVTPYYNKTTQKGLIAHFTKMAQSTDLPIIMYNVPSRTSLNMAPETQAALSKVDNIVGVKEASGDISQIAEVARLCGPDYDIYSGNDDQIVPIMALGGRGVITTMGNIVPKLAHDITAKFLAGDIKESLRLQLSALPLFKALFCEVNPIPIKTAVNLMGIPAGGCRLPLVEMDDAHLELLKKEMKAMNLM